MTGGSAGPLRELVRASAGAGKTYLVSSRIVGLLSAGAEPEKILASTFTRKAAGEILDRVLVRLADAALDPEKARELSEHAALPGAAPPATDRGAAPPATGTLDEARALELLRRLVGELHRIDVGTLDAFFVRMARSFGLELGLPPGWRVTGGQDPAAARVRAEAIRDVLGDGDPGAVVELLRAAARGRTTRRVHDRLARAVDGLHGVYRRVAPGASHPWSPFADGVRKDGPAEIPGGHRAAERREIAHRVAALEPPANRDGSPDSRWVGALEAASEALAAGDWESLWTAGLGKRFLAGGREYCRKPFPPGLTDAFRAARTLTRAELAPRLDAQARALGRLAGLYDERFRLRQREAGVYRFADVTRLLRDADTPVAGRRDLRYRLDRRAEHVLLDEFQDTSPSQWEALRPLVDRIAGAKDGGRCTVVADPKQSIYGWRGADPGLVERVGERYGLSRERLDRSWRSSPVVLEFVNLLFGEIAENPVVGRVERGPEVARRWAAYFDEHRPAPPREGTPGHVRLEAGPRDPGRGSRRPRLMARAADRVAELHAAAPGASIGVLTRRNRAVARLIHELRLRGVEASEEGGMPVDDAAPVAAVLALLRMADHPEHGIARYHVATTPLGEVVGYQDHTSDGGARALARRVRERLLRDGYGPTLAAWTRDLAGDVDARELHRLEQLVELGFRWEQRAGLRPGDFVRFARSERKEAPRERPVRVMTVHQAKGLEFDVVVLPELGGSLTGGGGRGPVALPERDEAGRVRRVFPYVRSDLRPLFPEIQEAVRQHTDSRFRDELSWLYVAVTRARHALHLLVAADGEGGPGSARSVARLVRAVVGAADEAVAEGDVLLELGDPAWHEAVPGTARRPDREPADEKEPGLRIDPARDRSRVFSVRSPSDLEGGDVVDVSRLLRLDTSDARRRGAVVHRWCEEIRWIEEGVPDVPALLEIARRAVPELRGGALGSLAERFGRWLEAPATREALSRKSAVSWGLSVTMAREVDVEVQVERPFAHREGDEVVSGTMDRLVLVRRRREEAVEPGSASGPVVAAQVLDFKTEARTGEGDAGLEDRVAFYRPQLRAYRRAVARLHDLPVHRVRARLVFLEAGAVVDL